MTPAKDHGQRGSCLSFSFAGSIEDVWQIGSCSVMSVSEQQLIDRANASTAGSQGWSMAGTILYDSGTAKAVDASYSYTARDGPCGSTAPLPFFRVALPATQELAPSCSVPAGATCSPQSISSQYALPLRLACTHFGCTGQVSFPHDAACLLSSSPLPSFWVALPVTSVGHFLFSASMSDMQSAIIQRPAAIAMEADHDAFQVYRSTSLVSFHQVAACLSSA